MTREDNANKSLDEQVPLGSFLLIVDCKGNLLNAIGCNGVSATSDLAEFLSEIGIELTLIGEVVTAVEESGVAFDLTLEHGDCVIRIKHLEEYEDLSQVIVVPKLDDSFDRLAESALDAFRNSKEGVSRRKVSDLKVLVVDDNELAIDLNARYFMILKCEFQSAMSGQEALCKIEENEFDLVFMDIHMPRLDGLETTRLLKKRTAEIRGHSPFVVGLSAAITPREHDSALKAGMDCLRLKPLGIDMIKELLVQFLDGESNVPIKLQDLASRNRDMQRTNLGKLPVLDFNHWKQDEKLHGRMLSMFRKQGSSLLAKADSLVEQEDWSELSETIHAFKGGADVVRADRLTHLCHELLGMINRGELRKVNDSYVRLADEFRNFEEVVQGDNIDPTTSSEG